MPKKIQASQGWMVYDDAGHQLAMTETEALADDLLSCLNGVRVVVNLSGGIVQSAFSNLRNTRVVTVDWDVDEDEKDHTYAKLNPAGPVDLQAGYDLHAWVYSPPCWSPAVTQDSQALVMADCHEQEADHPLYVSYEEVQLAAARRDTERLRRAATANQELRQQLSGILNQHQTIEACLDAVGDQLDSAALDKLRKASATLGQQLKELLPE